MHHGKILLTNAGAFPLKFFSLLVKQEGKTFTSKPTNCELCLQCQAPGSNQFLAYVELLKILTTGMDLLWSFIYTLVYTQRKSQGTKSKQGEGWLPFAILESSLNNCLLLDCAAQYELRPRHFPHAIKSKWLCFQVACALGGKLTRTGNGHDDCRLCSAMVPGRLFGPMPVWGPGEGVSSG